MENSDSLVEDDCSQRIAASHLHYREGDGLVVPGNDVLSQGSGRESNGKRTQLVLWLNLDQSELSGIPGGTPGISSDSSPSSSKYSRASSAHFRQSHDVVQATPSRLITRSTCFGPFLGSSHASPGVDNGRADWEVIQGSPNVSQMEPGTQKPPSPRTALLSSTTTNTGPPGGTTFGPLDNYLVQREGMTNLGGTPTKLGGDQNRIRHSRIDGLRLRTQLREKRKDLQRKSLAKSSADNAFMKYVRERRSLQVLFPVPQDSQDAALDALYEAMQAARDEYGEAEFAYNQLEDLVDEHEFDLAKLEGKLCNTDIYDIPQPPLITDNFPLPPESLFGIDSESPKKYHPLHVRYLTRLGDLDLARERYQNMTDERDGLLLQQESRLSLGIELHEGGKEFLAKFPTREAVVTRELAEIEEDVEHLRCKCLAEGIEIDEGSSDSQHGSHGTQEHRLEDFEHNITLTEGASLEPSMFPILLPKSEDRNKLGILITDFVEGNKNDRINRWMQYQLRTSPSEVELIYRVFLHLLQILSFGNWNFDLAEWQSSVLSWWPRDAANKPPGAFEAAHPQSAIGGTSSSGVPHDHSILDTVDKYMTAPNHGFIKLRRTRSAPVLAAAGPMFAGGVVSHWSLVYGVPALKADAI